jgi:hypothetical protein
MMDDVRRKVLLDIFAAPGALLPLAGGLTALMVSWAVGGNSALNFGGVAAMLGGFGIMASRLILKLDRITQDAYDYFVQKQRSQQEDALEKLEQRLLLDQDPRTQTTLRTLRHLYGRLKEKIDSGKVTPAAYGVIEGVDSLFQSCVKQLEASVDLWETAQTVRGSARRAMLEQREQLVQEVTDAVEHLGKTVERFHELETERNRSELGRLRRELDESMRVAREAERRTAELTQPSPSELKDWE